MMVQELADLIEAAGSESRKKTIVSFGQDRLDADVQGSVAVFDHILRARYGSSSICFYSKPVAFATSRMICDILPGCFARAEHTGDLSSRIARSPSIWVWDTTNFSQMGAFGAVLDAQDFRNGTKNVFVVDHHMDNNEGKGFENSPSSYGEQVRVLRYTTGANTSVVLGAMRALGIEFTDQIDHQARAIAAYLAIKMDTQGFKESYLSEIDRDAISYLDHVLSDQSKIHIQSIAASVPLSWRLVGQRARQHAKDGSFSRAAAYGVGVVDDFGIIPYAADALLECGFETSVVFGILVDGYGPWRSVTLNGSGRTRINDVIGLPDIFSELFYKEHDDGRVEALGGGRASDGGAYAMCAGEEDLGKLNQVGDRLIEAFIWPHHAKRMTDRITAAVPGAERVVIETLR